MANNPHFLATTRNAWLNQITTDLGTAAIWRIYAGVQPADVSSAITAANVVVASCPGASTNAFAAAAAGSMTANAISNDTNATGGTAAWFSIVKSTGLRVADGSIGTSGADLNLNSVTIATGATLSITAFSIISAA